MKIDFDPDKNQRNVELRGLSFEQVARFDFETALFWVDDRKNYPELRISALGLIEHRVYSVVFTETSDGIRVISFRKDNKREATRYGQEIESRTN